MATKKAPVVYTPAELRTMRKNLRATLKEVEGRIKPFAQELAIAKKGVVQAEKAAAAMVAAAHKKVSVVQKQYDKTEAMIGKECQKIENEIAALEPVGRDSSAD